VQPLQQSKIKILSAGQRKSDWGEQAAAIKGFASFAVTRLVNIIAALRQFVILSARNLRIISRDRTSLILMLAAAPLVGMLDLILAGAMGSAPFDFQDGDFFFGRIYHEKDSGQSMHILDTAKILGKLSVDFILL
jgi:hypothetical protein